MDVKNFVLTYYKDASDGFHIQRIEKPTEAKKLHSHDYFQIYYIEKGTITHYLEDSASRLVAGDMFIIPPHVTHYISGALTCILVTVNIKLHPEFNLTY